MTGTASLQPRDTGAARSVFSNRMQVDGAPVGSLMLQKEWSDW